MKLSVTTLTANRKLRSKMKAKSCGQAGPDRVAKLLRVNRLESSGELIADAAPGLVGVLSVANPMKRGESALGEKS